MTHAYYKFSPTDFRNICRKRYNRHLATDIFFFSVDVNTICNSNESFSFSGSVLTWRFKSFIGNELIDRCISLEKKKQGTSVFRLFICTTCKLKTTFVRKKELHFRFRLFFYHGKFFLSLPTLFRKSISTLLDHAMTKLCYKAGSVSRQDEANPAL